MVRFTRRALSIVLLVAVAAVAAGVWYMEKNSGVALPAYATTTPIASPARLIIPAIGVDAAVQHVGIAPTGNMAVPDNYSDVGWYRLGAHPGEEGNAVIAGHLDNGFGLPAVFSRLEKLSVGDEILVQGEEGETATFIVEHLSIYDPAEAPLEEIFGSSTDARLNLITCDGAWNPKTKTYSERLVVFARAATSTDASP